MKILPFKEAVEYFKKKTVLSGAGFDALAAGIGDFANAQAFTVAKVASADVLQDIYDEVLKAIEKGQTLWDFREGIDDIMARRGWEGLSPYRLDNILRTNVQTAYNAGRYKKMKAIAGRRPYWQYDAVNDQFTRPSHAAHDGKVYHHEHPFWDTWMPPNGYRCFPVGTQVLTPSGWQTIETIKRKDRVIGGSGQEKSVTAVHRNSFDGDLIRLIFKNGRIDATPNHRILTMRGWVRAEFLEAKDILIETPKKVVLDSFVGNKNMSDSKRRNGSVPFPVQRKAACMLTADAKVQLRHEHVNPFRPQFRVNDVIMDRTESTAIEMIKHKTFSFCRRCIVCAMRGGISTNIQTMRFRIFQPDFRANGRGILFKFFCRISCALVSLFGFACTRMISPAFHAATKLFHEIGCFFSALLRGMEPLSAYSGAPFTGRDFKMFKEQHQSTCSNSPSRTKLPVRKFIPKVKDIKGFGHGAPLDYFDTLDSFRAWARSHCILRKIRLIEKIPYNGTVCNLSVEKDESYIVYGSTVHNCRCRVTSLSMEEMEEEGLKEETKGTDLTPDEGFQYNPATEKWKPDTGKYSPGLREQVGEAIYD